VNNGHRPSAVLELPNNMWWCLKCQKPWPCPDSESDPLEEMWSAETEYCPKGCGVPVRIGFWDNKDEWQRNPDYPRHTREINGWHTCITDID